MGVFVMHQVSDAVPFILLMFVVDVKGDHKVEAYSSIGLVTAVYSTWSIL